jgi:hypothetical protein
MDAVSTGIIGLRFLWLLLYRWIEVEQHYLARVNNYKINNNEPSLFVLG